LIPVGAKVEIRKYETNPEFWDIDGTMMKLSGRKSTVSEVFVANRYKLKNYPWTWRERDLIVLSATNDPNYAFKVRKGR